MQIELLAYYLHVYLSPLARQTANMFRCKLLLSSIDYKYVALTGDDSVWAGASCRGSGATHQEHEEGNHQWAAVRCRRPHYKIPDWNI